jgi:enterochelin esterase-like enzyme
MIETALLPGQLYYSIYLPPCYSTEEEYPSLYLLHGLSYSDNQWIRLGVTDLADQLIGDGTISPLIIVMPYNPNPNRSPDSNFGKALSEALIPYIDANYSTCIETECRSIGGLSRGGGWAFDIFLNHPELFSAVGGHSPALFQRTMERFMDKMTNVWSGQRIWMDVGEMDQEKKYLIGIDSALTSEGIPHIFILESGEHDEDYWKMHLKEYLLWYADGAKP